MEFAFECAMEFAVTAARIGRIVDNAVLGDTVEGRYFEDYHAIATTMINCRNYLKVKRKKALSLRHVNPKR